MGSKQQSLDITPNDSWDWPLLYYAGTVTLRMSPAQFWRCTPRKLDLLLKVHVRVNATEEDQERLPQEDRKVYYIDQVF